MSIFSVPDAATNCHVGVSRLGSLSGVSALLVEPVLGQPAREISVLGDPRRDRQLLHVFGVWQLGVEDQASCQAAAVDAQGLRSCQQFVFEVFVQMQIRKNTTF